MRPLPSLPLALALGLGACSDEVPLEFSVGPVGFVVDASRISLPANLQTSGRVARIPCTTQAMCPPLGASLPTLRCAAGACDPAPYAFDLGVMDAVDLGTYSPQLSVVASNIQSITVTQMSWQAAAMGLTVPVGPVDLYWGPESATGIGDGGVRLLGRVASLAFSSAGTASGDVALDAGGNAAFSDHVLRVSRRFRIFARATVDLAPGGALPAGRATLQLRMSVRASTRLLR